MNPGLAAGRVAERRAFRYGFKVAVAVALAGWLVAYGGAQRVVSSLTSVAPLPFLLAVGLYLVGQSLCACKWRLLAGQLGFRRPLRFYWVHYLGAMFPSLFLPTSVGGDVYRALALAAGGG